MYTWLLAAAAASKCFLHHYYPIFSLLFPSVFSKLYLHKHWLFPAEASLFFLPIFCLFFFLFFSVFLQHFSALQTPSPCAGLVTSLPRDAGQHSGMLWAERGNGGVMVDVHVGGGTVGPLAGHLHLVVHILALRLFKCRHRVIRVQLWGWRWRW